jgi:hypothetical protein
MKTRIVIGLLCIAVVLAWKGIGGAQGPRMPLPSGDTVPNLEGLWNVVVENYGEMGRYGTYPNMFLIQQTGNAFSATRMWDNPPPSSGKAGGPTLFGELEKDGFKFIYMIDSGGQPWPSKGQISEDGKKIVIERGTTVRSTLTRRY